VAYPGVDWRVRLVDGLGDRNGRLFLPRDRSGLNRQRESDSGRAHAPGAWKSSDHCISV